MNTKQLIKLLIFLPVFAISAGLIGMFPAPFIGPFPNPAIEDGWETGAYTYLGIIPQELRDHIDNFVYANNVVYSDDIDQNIIKKSVENILNAFRSSNLTYSREILDKYSKKGAYCPPDGKKDEKMRRKVFYDCTNQILSDQSNIANLVALNQNLPQELKDFIAILNKTDYFGAFHNAIRSNLFDYIPFLVEMKHDKQFEEFGSDALSFAAGAGNSEALEILIHNGFNVDRKSTSNQKTALMCAAQFGRLQGVQLLIKNYKALIDLQDDQGRTALSYAAENGHIEVLKYLLSMEATVDPVDQSTGCTPLFFAAQFSNHDALDALLAKRAAVNKTDNDGHTPLIDAAENGYTLIVQKLCEADANINIVTNCCGQNALIAAAENDHLDIVEYLVNKTKPANINLCDNDGKNALSYAIKNNNSKMQELLRAAGAKEPVIALTPVIASIPVIAPTTATAPTPPVVTAAATTPAVVTSAPTPFWSKVKNWFSNTRNREYFRAGIITAVTVPLAIKYRKALIAPYGKMAHIDTQALLPYVQKVSNYFAPIAQNTFNSISHSLNNPANTFCAGMIFCPIAGVTGCILGIRLLDGLDYLSHKWNAFSWSHPRAARLTKRIGLSTAAATGLAFAGLKLYQSFRK